MTLLVLLLILVVTFGVVRVAGARAGHRVNASRAGQISLALLFLFTGLGYFAETEQMAKMLPFQMLLIAWAYVFAVRRGAR